MATTVSTWTCGNPTLIRPERPVLTPLPRADGGPAFEEPWQARILALVHALTRDGAIGTAEWAETLGEELRRAEERGAPDDRHTYFAAALAALERLVARRGAVSAEALADRIEAWRRAYLNTPHGKPVGLSAAGAPRP